MQIKLQIIGSLALELCPAPRGCMAVCTVRLCVTHIVELCNVVVLETLQINGDQPVTVHTQDSEPWEQE